MRFLKKIVVNLVFAVKDNKRHKICLVAGGHLTSSPFLSGVHAGIASPRGPMACTVPAGLDETEAFGTDTWNTNLEALLRIFCGSQTRA